MHAADETLCGVGNDIRFFILEPFVLISEFALSTRSGKLFAYIDYPYDISLMCKLKSSIFGQKDMSFGFDCDCTRRQEDFSKRVVNPLSINIIR